MACPAGTHFLPVSPTLDDVRCHRPAIYLHDFDRFGDGFWNVFLGTCQDFSLDSQLDSFQDPLVLFELYSWTVLFAEYFGLACRPTDINLPFWFLCCPRDSKPGWGDWSRSFCGWGFSVFAFFCLSKLMSVLLLVTRLGLMPCSAWSKKKHVHVNIVGTFVKLVGTI